jgi:hypothetical protein
MLVRGDFLSVVLENNVIYCLLRKEGNITLASVDPELKIIKEKTKFEGKKGFILGVYQNGLLISVDDKLIHIENNEWKVVLKASRSTNVFWHACKVGGTIFIQEYGETPTGIYASQDFRNWERLVTNEKVDKSSKHFHYITYDPYRKWLIATLGDKNLTRVIVSKDLGKSWKPLYKGPWQFVPVVCLRDKLVFGMDSYIVRGGIGICNPENESWSFIFLKWRNKRSRFAQICDLKLLDNGLWVATFGTPQAILISKDLRAWYLVHVEGYSTQFNHYMNVSEGKGTLVCSTGESLVVFRKNELESLMLKTEPVMTSYSVHFPHLVNLKHKLKTIIRKVI